MGHASLCKAARSGMTTTICLMKAKPFWCRSTVARTYDEYVVGQNGEVAFNDRMIDGDTIAFKTGGDDPSIFT